MDPLTMAGVDLGAALLQTGGNKLLDIVTQKRTMRRNKELIDYQNEYNSPKMQMVRLKEAGLNPNLVYGGGNVSGNLTGPMPKYQENESTIQITPPSDTISKYQNIQESKQRVSNQLAMEKLNKQVLLNQEINNQILGTKYLSDLIDLNVKTGTEGYQIDKARTQLDLLTENLAGAKELTGLRKDQRNSNKVNLALLKTQLASAGLNLQQQEIMLNNIKNGIYPNAPWAVQVTNAILKGMGFNSWKELVESMSDIWVND